MIGIAFLLLLFLGLFHVLVLPCMHLFFIFSLQAPIWDISKKRSNYMKNPHDSQPRKRLPILASLNSFLSPNPSPRIPNIPRLITPSLNVLLFHLIDIKVRWKNNTYSALHYSGRRKTDQNNCDQVDLPNFRSYKISSKTVLLSWTNKSSETIMNSP